jgi:hypothetical protein
VHGSVDTGGARLALAQRELADERLERLPERRKAQRADEAPQAALELSGITGVLSPEHAPISERAEHRDSAAPLVKAPQRVG